MSSENGNPDQSQNKIAMALGRLRGDVMPPITSQAAARLSDPVSPAPSATMPSSNVPGQRAEPSFGAAPANTGTNPGPSISVSTGSPSFTAVPSQPVPYQAPTLSGGGIGNGAGVTPPNGGPNLTGAAAPSASMVSQMGSIGNNASGGNYFGPAASAATQPDLLSGVDMGPPPLGGDYPRSDEGDARRRRNRRWAMMGAGLIVLVIVGYWIGTRHHGDVPVIAADSTPEKVKPTDQGGLQVPNQNVQVLENMNGQAKSQSGETVLPPPEQPVTPPAPTVTDQTVAQPAAPATGTDQTLQVPSVPAPAATPTAPATETPAASAAPAAPAVPSVPAVPAVPDSGSAAMTGTPAVPATPATGTTASAATNPQPATTTAPATPTSQPVAKTTTAPAATPGGKVRVQLAAVKSEAAAKSTWAKLQKTHPDQLGNLSLMIEKVDKGADGIFYRVQAGPLADKATAKSICSALSAQGQACLIAR